MYQHIQPPMIIDLRDGLIEVMELYSRLDHQARKFEDLLNDVLRHLSVLEFVEGSLETLKQRLTAGSSYFHNAPEEREALCLVIDKLAALILTEFQLHHAYDNSGMTYYRFSQWVSESAFLLKPLYNQPCTQTYQKRG